MTDDRNGPEEPVQPANAAPAPAPAVPPAPAEQASPAPVPAPEAAAPDAAVAEAPTPDAEQTEAGAPVDAAAPGAAEPAPDAQPAPRTPRRRGRIAALAGAGVLLLAVLGGTGYTVVTVQDADRDAGRPAWRFPKAVTDEKPAEAHKTGLGSLLLPYGESSGYGRGPDMGEFGSDAELSGRQATELRKESIKGLPRSQRRQLEREIDRQRIKGMAMRSYLGTASPGSSFDGDKLFVVDVVLSQMGSRGAVRSVATAQQDFFDALHVFRKGPKIEGHKNAQCFLPPTDADEKLDMMVCSAYEGDILISATATGTKSLDKKGVAELLRKQLDLVSDPGEAV
ncbi:hypothetical protein [Streptomyces sp. NPDC005301]|uniref:hypothetical protein n=1 Tax=Streptomyces sp. NPDC005301 TaxID=3156874 RepID=UPI0033A3D96E